MRTKHGLGPMTSIIGLISVLALTAAPALAVKTIDNIKVTNLREKVEIRVGSANGAIKFNAMPSGKGDYISFGIAGKCRVAGKFVGIRSGRIAGVRYGSFSERPPVTRVVVNSQFGTYPQYSTDWSSDRRNVTISVWKDGIKPKVTQIAEPYAIVPLPTPFIRRVVEQKGSDSGMEPLRSVSVPVASEPVMLAAPASVRPGVRNISLDFIAADINDVFKALSVQSGANIVCGTDVKGNVTVSLNKVSVDEALDYVTKLSGYKYAKDGDTYVVGSAQGVTNIVGGESSDSPASAAVCIRFSDLKGLQDMLTKQYPDMRFSANIDPEKDKDKPGPKLLAFVGTKLQVVQVKNLVESVESALAKESDGRSIEVYEVKYADPKELVVMLKEVMPQIYVNLAATDGFGLQAPGAVNIDSNQGATVQLSVQPASAQKTYQRILLAGTIEDVKRAVDILVRTDVKLPQIRIEAKVTDISLNAEKRLGVQWSWSEVGWAQRTDNKDILSVPDKVTKIFHHLPVDVSAAVDAMFKDGTAKILANPSITTVEGKPGVFFVGDEIKYIINISSGNNGTTIQTDTAKVGVQLRVVADVSPDREITLSLHPEVSVITDMIRFSSSGGTNALASGIVLPQIARRFTDQVIRVKDGDSIAIGGLIKENEINNVSKVPLLGDLPFFGNLFKHRQKTKEKSEVVIFLKATIVE